MTASARAIAWMCVASAAIAVIAAVGCGRSGPTLPVQRHPSPVARIPGRLPARIVVVVMENQEYDDVIGSSSAPYIDALARRYALATSSYAITHPSLPNYLALTGGSTFGIDSDCTGCSVGATSLVDQLPAAHVGWKAYMEDLPHPCFFGSGARGYAEKHNPFAYYTRARRSCNRVVPLTQLAADERRALPRFIWITPNLCHDMHDCDVASGDRFLSGLLPPLLRSLGSHGILILTWDEGASDDGCCRLASGGHIATIVAGPGARAGARLATPVDHYSVLQLIEDLLGLPRLRGAACPCTSSLRPLLVGR